MTPKDVPLFVSGRAKVRVLRLERALGSSAWFVLRALWRARDPKTGTTHVTNAGLARYPGFVALSVRVVRKAVARLAEAGLVEVVGWAERVVRWGNERHPVRVFVRRVRGAEAEAGLDAALWCFAPGKTALWVDSASVWGGARRGAGRPATRQDPLPVVKEDPPIENRNSRGADLEFKRGRPPGIQEGPTILDKRSYILTEAGLVTSSPAIAAPQPAAIVATSSSEPERMVELPAGLGDAFGTRRERPPVLPTSALRDVPPPPWELVGYATVPYPPLLEADMSATEAAIRISDAYRGAVTRYMQLDVRWAFGRGAFQRSRFWKVLLAARDAMLEREIPPAAWAAWSVNVWRIFGSTKRPPPVPWLLGAGRIVERSGWFEREAGAYMGGRIVNGPKKLALLERYARMRRAIDVARAWASPAEVVERFFPGDAFDRAVEAARAEVVATQAKLRTDVDMGVFVW